MIDVTLENPATPDARNLIDASEAELAAIYPPEERFALSVDELLAQDVRFHVARMDGAAVGCGGLAVFEGYGELKRIFVAREARGKGVSHAILQALEDCAAAEHLPVVRLETGAEQKAAMHLYASRGYVRCGTFGNYPENGASIFMEKRL